MAPTIGSEVPDVTLLEGQPDYAPPTPHSLKALCAPGKTVVIFAIPGAFTPTCSKTHLPSFLTMGDQLRAAGVDTVICTCTNDPFVCYGWATSLGVPRDSILVLSDDKCELCRALGEVSGTETFVRTKRYAMIVRDGKVTHFMPGEKEDGEKCPKDTYADAVIAALKA